MNDKSKRFMELEGLRGVAALIVAFYHFALAFYLAGWFGIGSTSPQQHAGWERFVYANPLGGLFSGTFSVAIFFVLSGFVLSIGFFQTGRISIIRRLAAKRYLRLMLPALASVMVCYVLMKLGLGNTQQAAVITKSGWLADNWNFAPHLGRAVYQATVGVFGSGYFTAPDNWYNNVLWTMVTEFLGSFLIFASLVLFGVARRRGILYAVLVLMTFNTWFLGFVLGMVMADFYARGWLMERRRSYKVIAGALLAGVYLGGYPFGANLAGTAYGWIQSLPLITGHQQIMSTTVGATIIVLTALLAAQFAAILRRDFFSRLGKYTFSLYLIHLPILYSLTTGLFVAAHNYVGYNKSVAIAVVSSVPLVWLGTYFFEKYVDAPSVQVASLFADVYFGKQRVYVRGWRVIELIEKAVTVRLAPRADGMTEEALQESLAHATEEEEDASL